MPDNKDFLGVLLIIGIIIALVVFLLPNQQEYAPQVDLALSKYSISVGDGQTSEFLTATVTKADSKNVTTSFILRFIPSNSDYVSVLDAENKQRIDSIQTTNLTEINRQFQYQFTVLGKRVSGSPQSEFNITIQVWFNNTKIQEKTLDVMVI